MPDDTLRTMLILAGLTYRGFQDVLPGDPHEVVVRRALRDGLAALAPVSGQWNLVWGPVTSRVPFGVFDSNAMYVVRHVREPHRYVVAIRGTNPVASTDWLFGDLWVGQTVAWPYASDGAAISMSTALGLASLQGMRSRPPSTVGQVAENALSFRPVSAALDRLSLAGRAALSGTTETHVAHPSLLAAQIERVVSAWTTQGPRRHALEAALQQAGNPLRVESADLRPTWRSREAAGDDRDLLSFLKDAADQTAGGALDVAVTGHSKGGALASTVALWLKDALACSNAAERWGDDSRIRVSAYAFAGPTPGNDAFARRIDAMLGDGHHHLRNTNDLVTNAWAVADLQRLPTLYGNRTAVFGPLLPDALRIIQPLGYTHAQRGMTTFTGTLGSDDRLLPLEVIHQHMDAYLDHLELLSPDLNPVTFFI